MDKLETEAEEKRTSVRLQADREITLARETATDLLHICSNPDEAEHYFYVAERPEIEENEFNLNVPEVCGYV